MPKKKKKKLSVWYLVSLGSNSSHSKSSHSLPFFILIEDMWQIKHLRLHLEVHKGMEWNRMDLLGKGMEWNEIKKSCLDVLK